MSTIEDYEQRETRGRARLKVASRGWRPRVHRRLCQMIDETSGRRRVAVFDFDNTCILGDIGELFGHAMIEEMRYRYDLEAFWELIEAEDRRDRLRRLTEEALQVDPEQRASSTAYERYLAESAALYGRRLRRLGKRACYEWAVRLHVGLSETDVETWSNEVVEAELARRRAVEMYRTGDGERVEIQRGIRPFVEIRELIETLHRQNWEVWIVSASNVWTVRAFAAYFGVSSERVIGNRVEVREGRLTARTEEPVLFREGKVEAIDKNIGRAPALVVGDAITDYEMLETATGLAILVDRGNEWLRNKARNRGWAVQPQGELTPLTTATGDREVQTQCSVESQTDE